MGRFRSGHFLDWVGLVQPFERYFRQSSFVDIQLESLLSTDVD